MTNAEKYKEVFGMEVDYASCPTEDCTNCPLHGTCSVGCTYDWWKSEYKGVTNGT